VSGLHNPKTTLWEWQKKIKRYFHVLYEGDKRTYGGAGRNSEKDEVSYKLMIQLGFSSMFLRPFIPAPEVFLLNITKYVK